MEAKVPAWAVLLLIVFALFIGQAASELSAYLTAANGPSIGSVSR